MHTIEIKKFISLASDGLVLGNGRFSASCFQQPGKIIFQLGQNEFWDLRLITKDNPRPAHINELKEALRNNLAVDGLTNKSNAAAMSPRIQEVCKRVPSQNYASPIPKPGPMLCIHYPADWQDLEITQTLEIENGKLIIELRHTTDGAGLHLEAAVHPEDDRLTISWKLSNWSAENVYGGYLHGLPELPPVYATLFKAPEADLEDFCQKEFISHGNDFFCYMQPPGEKMQTAACENVLTMQIPDSSVLYAAIAVRSGEKTIARKNAVRFLPPMDSTSGEITAALSMKSADTAAECAAAGCWDADEEAARKSGEEFWKKSAVDFQDTLLNDAWYGALHAKRCMLKRDVLPPGLFFPSSLEDYSMWHGDYHFNYNYQSIFLGDYETNHLETGDAYFEGVRHQIEIGELISERYYDIKGGCFIQLAGYPLHAEDDYFGSLPLGRMAYMTGWVAAYFYRRWLLTGDRDFLEKQAYPELRKFARFYAGFLEKGDDGLYHAFPSNQGECDFDYAGSFDQKQVLHHACWALRAAAECADELQIDAAESAVWRNISQNMPKCEELASGVAPEFSAFDGLPPAPGVRPDFLVAGDRFHDWYYGQMPFKLSVWLRSNCWLKEWFDELRNFMKRWQMPNNMMRAMSIATHGFRSNWTESLGTVGALTDMLLVGDGGVIRLFPGIPDGRSASFRTLRTEGAFLVSAVMDSGKVKNIEITSDAGSCCRILNPDADGRWDMGGKIISGEFLTFDTEKGQTYTLTLLD